MRNRWVLGISILLLACLAACKGQKLTVGDAKAVSPKKLDQLLIDNRMDYEWFTARARMTYVGGGMNQSFTANIRLRSDSVIWVSLTGFLGLEGARVIMTQDSLHAIDKINKKYYAEPLTKLREFLPIQGIDFAFIEDVLLGNHLALPIRRLKAGVAGNLYYTENDWQGSLLTLYVLPEMYRYKRVAWQSALKTERVDMSFDDYRMAGDYAFAHTRRIETEQAQNKASIDIEYHRIQFNQPAPFPFQINRRYERAEL